MVKFDRFDIIVRYLYVEESQGKISVCTGQEMCLT